MTLKMCIRDRYSPFPEEMNRKLVSAIADLYFCPTAHTRANLEREGITKGLFVPGNTVIDTLKTTVRPDYRFSTEELKDVYKRQVIHSGILIDLHAAGGNILGGGGEAGAVVGSKQVVVDGLGHAHHAVSYTHLPGSCSTRPCRSSPALRWGMMGI